MILLALIFSLDSLLLQGIDLSYKERYTQAESVFFYAGDMYPENPAPYFFLSTLYATYMTDFETDSLREEFFAYTDITVAKADSILAITGDPWAYTWKGGGLIGRAYYKYRRGDILGMLGDGVRGIDALKSALALDSRMYDAHIGLGMYEYVNQRIRGIFPFTAKSDRWRELLNLASDSACFLSIAAKNTIALLLIEERDWDNAIELSKELLKKYPNSRTFTWTLAKACYGKKDWEKAEMVFRRLIGLIKRVDALYPLVYAMDKLCEVYLQGGKYEECRVEASRILDITEGKGERYTEFRERAKRYLTADLAD